MTLIERPVLDDCDSALGFSIALPSDWTGYAAHAEKDKIVREDKPSELVRFAGLSTPGRLIVYAARLRHDLNPIDLALCSLLAVSADVSQCVGQKTPLGKSGFFAYKAVAGADGRLLATRNGPFVVLIQAESPSSDISLDEMIDSLNFRNQMQNPLEDTTVHGVGGCQFSLPANWNRLSENSFSAVMQQASHNNVFIAVDSRVSSVSPQESVCQSLSEIELDIQYTGGVLDPTPSASVNIERYRMQTACTIAGEPGIMLLMHHRQGTHFVNMIACLPLATANPVSWAVGKYGLEMALSTVQL